MPPQIDLPPSKYRWRRPLSPWLAWGSVLIGAALLVSFFIGRDEGDATSLFFATAVVSFGLGLVIAGIFRDID